MDKALDQFVRNRARHRCEYCHVPQAYYRTRYHFEHVGARKHRGPTSAENLALSCVECNLRKGTNLAGLDPETGQVALVFNPREQRWADHFAWSGAKIVGLTPIGRVTVAILDLNRAPRVLARQALIAEGVLTLDDAES